MPIDFQRYDYVKNATRVSRYRDAEKVLVNRSFLSGAFETESAPFKKDTIFEINGSPHKHRRRAVSPLFTRSAAASYELDTLNESLRDQLHQLAVVQSIGRLVAIDLVRFTRLAMVSVAARIIGIDATGRLDRLLALADPIGMAADVKWSDRPHREVIAEGHVAKEEFVNEFLLPAITVRISEPTTPATDLMSALLETLDQPAVDVETLGMLTREAIIFLTAGVRTTAHAVSHTVHELWHQEDTSLAELTLDELRAAGTEALRLHPPAPALVRQATEPVVLPSGLSIGDGDLVAIDLESCNRDPEVFGPDADAFVPDRNLPQGVHGYGLSFGAGPHVCLGKGLSVSTSASVGQDDALRTVVRVLETLRALGLEANPDEAPEKMVSGQDRWETYPVTLRTELLRAAWA